MELSPLASVVAALAIAIVLSALHLATPILRNLRRVPETVLGSFAVGLAVAYVFLHLLPELAEGNERVAEALGEVVRSTPLLDLSMFLVALSGFTLFYGLERLAQRGGERTERVETFRLHLGSFLVYNALITYTMPLRLRTGVDFALLFTVAMGLHLRAHRPRPAEELSPPLRPRRTAAARGRPAPRVAALGPLRPLERPGREPAHGAARRLGAAERVQGGGAGRAALELRRLSRRARSTRRCSSS